MWTRTWIEGKGRSVVVAALVVMAAGFLAASLQAQEGTWSSTGAMTVGRAFHTTTLLANGKVLVAGGKDSNKTYLSSCELYDPATGVWSATSSMAAARVGHTATLLANGKVLVAGGDVSGLPSCELYDSATGAWSATGSLVTARSSHTATLLANGKVLVAGGSGSSATPLSSCELYDPATGAWSVTGDITLRSFTATLLPNGKVLAAGGVASVYLSSCELYDPATGTWSSTGSLAEARSLHRATLLASGKVLVAGGVNNLNYLASCELYDPVTGAWSSTGSMAEARTKHTATFLSNGKVLVAGGTGAAGGYFNTCELYDPATGTWSSTGSMVTGRVEHVAALLANGNVLVVGGYVYGSTNLASCELYNAGSSSSYAIAGKVTLASTGAALSGVTVSTGGASSTTTGSDGTYTSSGLANGSYTVTPTLSGYTFTPTTKSVTVSGADQAGVDFAATKGGSGGSITITAPKGGESYKVGDICPITWTSSGVVGDVLLEVICDVTKGKTTTANSGSFNWQITSDWPASDSYQVRLSSVNDPTITTTSNGYFSITGGGGGGYKVTIGSTFDVTASNEYDKKPKVYVSVGKSCKTAKVCNTCSDFPTSSLFCEWTAKCAPGEYTLSASGVSGKEKCVEDLGTIEIMLPSITSMSSTDWVCGETVTVLGEYFGKKPKVWVSCTDCKGKPAKRSCKLVAPAFEPFTGASSLDFIVPKFKTGDYGFVFHLSNAIGETSYGE